MKSFRILRGNLGKTTPQQTLLHELVQEVASGFHDGNLIVSTPRKSDRDSVAARIVFADFSDNPRAQEMPIELIPADRVVVDTLPYSWLLPPGTLQLRVGRPLLKKESNHEAILLILQENIAQRWTGLKREADIKQLFDGFIGHTFQAGADTLRLRSVRCATFDEIAEKANIILEVIDGEHVIRDIRVAVFGKRSFQEGKLNDVRYRSVAFVFDERPDVKDACDASYDEVKAFMFAAVEEPQAALLIQ